MLERLATEIEEARRMAIARELADCGAESLMPDLLRLVGSESEAAPAAAFVCSEWAARGLVSAQYGPAVARYLTHTSPEVRQWCAAALRGVRPPACMAAEPLAKLLEDPDPGVRQAAVDALGQVAAGDEATVLRLLDLLHDDHAVRNAVIRVIGLLPTTLTQAVTEKLMGLMRAANPKLRAGAVAAGGVLLDACPELVPLLTERLADADASVRSAAARGLSEVGHPPKAVVIALGKALRDPFPDVRREAARALDLFGATAAPAAPYLVAVLRDTDSTVRFHAVEALEKLAPAQPRLLPAVVLALGNRLIDSDVAVQTRALSAFGRLAPYAYPLNANLCAAAQNPDPEVRLAAIEALALIRHEGLQVREILRQALHDPDGTVRVASALALAQRRDTSSDIVPTLAQALSEPGARVQIAAIQALKAIGRGAVQALAALENKKTDSNPEIRELAQQAISTITGRPLAESKR